MCDKMEIERVAATGGSFLGPIKNRPSENGMCNHVKIGDVICLSEDKCKVLGDIPIGEYVVEDARDHGGWMVMARKLDAMGRYCTDNPMVRFYQCPGYSRSLLLVKVVRRMTRIFI